MTYPMVLTLQVQKRDIRGRKVRALREAQQIPAVLYGHGFASEPVTLARREFDHCYRSAGESTLIDVVVDSATPVKALIHDVAHDPVSGAVTHVDLYRVLMTEKITTEIPLVFVGEAPAVKELGGILVKNLTKVKVSCLPTDLVQSVTVDCSSLKTFDDFIYVRDLSIPQKITVLDHTNEIVVTVTPPREEEVAPAPTSEAEAVAGVKVAGEEKKEGEEGAAAVEGEKSAKGGSSSGGKEEKKEKKK